MRVLSGPQNFELWIDAIHTLKTCHNHEDAVWSADYVLSNVDNASLVTPAKQTTNQPIDCATGGILPEPNKVILSKMCIFFLAWDCCTLINCKIDSIKFVFFFFSKANTHMYISVPI